jgi:hypothetical protein
MYPTPPLARASSFFALREWMLADVYAVKPGQKETPIVR